MIGRLTGHIVAQEDDGTAVLDVSGVGYLVTIPLGCLGRARQDAEGRTVLHVHTHATREEAMILYGFPSAEERQVFRTVIGVPNVGPKMALAILGALTVQELATAIALKDLTRLTSISGSARRRPSGSSSSSRTSSSTSPPPRPRDRHPRLAAERPSRCAPRSPTWAFAPTRSTARSTACAIA